MAITVHCPHCQGEFNVRDDFAGRKGRCPQCQGVVHAPTAEELAQVAHELELPPTPTRRAAPPMPAPTPPSLPTEPVAVSPGSGFPLDVSQETSVTARAGGGSRRGARSRNKQPMWALLAAFAAVPVILVLLAIIFVMKNNNGGESSEQQTAQEDSGSADEEDLSDGEPTLVADSSFGEPEFADPIDEITASMVKIVTPLGNNNGRLGAGFIIDRRGWVATNYHVIEVGNQFTTVYTANGTPYKVAGLIAASPERDLAILKLAEMPLIMTVADITYRGEPRRAEKVTAYGHPEGFEFSVCDGIVSRVVDTDHLPEGEAKSFFRDVMRAPMDQIWIQHTAPITHGNSGGPLLNEDFRIIGINTWVFAGANLGFASHIRYMREMQSAARDEAEPFPELEFRTDKYGTLDRGLLFPHPYEPSFPERFAPRQSQAAGSQAAPGWSSALLSPALKPAA